mgnify:CR=1 FL=1
MAKIHLNPAQRIVAYHMAIAWGNVKKAGGTHARRIARICDRFGIDELEEDDRKNALLAEAQRTVRRHDDKTESFDLDEADMEFYRSLMLEYFEKAEGLPEYF